MSIEGPGSADLTGDSVGMSANACVVGDEMTAPSGHANCDTPCVPRTQRQIERVLFGIDELGEVVAHMARLSSAEDGWINMIPMITSDDERPTSLRFFTLLSGGSTGDTMCTWIPRSRNRRGDVLPSLGIADVTGHRVFADLHASAFQFHERG